MKFKFDKHGIDSYIKCLQKRVNEVKKKYIEITSKTLYELSPKAGGALASSYNISVDVPDFYFNKNKKTPDFSIPNVSLDQTLYISSGCPYLNVLNYGTSKKPPLNFIEQALSSSEQKMISLIPVIGKTDF